MCVSTCAHIHEYVEALKQGEAHRKQRDIHVWRSLHPNICHFDCGHFAGCSASTGSEPPPACCPQSTWTQPLGGRSDPSPCQDGRRLRYSPPPPRQRNDSALSTRFQKEPRNGGRGPPQMLIAADTLPVQCRSEAPRSRSSSPLSQDELDKVSFYFAVKGKKKILFVSLKSTG